MEALFTTYLCEVHLMARQPGEAAALAERALALSRERFERATEARALYLLGEIAARGAEGLVADRHRPPLRRRPGRRWLRGPAITEIDSPHLRGGCRLIAELHLLWGRGPSDLIAWESGGNGPGTFPGQWESDRISLGPALGRASSLAARPDLDFQTRPHLPAPTANPF
jgi:hypothetical protein